FYMVAAEVPVHILPLFRDRLDTVGPQFLGEKLVVLAVGIVCYVLLTWLAYQTAVKNFEKQDL
ncbi:MAG: hypothetical protein IIY02_06955, partial [Firmicutes bacterium]|nr:hypothetical protein [Bacillota bacterium]